MTLESKGHGLQAASQIVPVGKRLLEWTCATMHATALVTSMALFIGPAFIVSSVRAGGSACSPLERTCERALQGCAQRLVEVV